MPTDTRPFKTALREWAREVHGRALTDMPDRMRPYAPLGKVVPRGRTPGELRKSIRKDPRVNLSATKASGRIVAPVIQAETTEHGARPHIIRPRRAGGLLVFYWSKVGRIVGFHYVNHPGNAPKPWWEKALRAAWGPSLRFEAIRTPFRRR